MGNLTSSSCKAYMERLAYMDRLGGIQGLPTPRSRQITHLNYSVNGGGVATVLSAVTRHWENLVVVLLV